MKSHFLSRILASLAALGLVATMPGARAVVVAPRSSDIYEREQQGFVVKLDGTNQRIYLTTDAIEQATIGPLNPTLARFTEHPFSDHVGFANAAMLAIKAKQFDDGLYAAVEVAAQKGQGKFIGKDALLKELCEHLSAVPSDESATNVPTVIASAARLGQVQVNVPDAIDRAAAIVANKFQKDDVNKPMGFYTWTPGLEDIYRETRMLHAPLHGTASIEALATLIRKHPQIDFGYRQQLALFSQLTNPPDRKDLANYVATKATAKNASSNSEETPVFVLPESVSPEIKYLKSVMGDRPIPDDFDLSNQCIAAIRDGKASLLPTRTSGWYDYQAWALEPLVIPDKMPEAKRLTFGVEYKRYLEEMFKTLLALTRETHVAHVTGGGGGGAAGGRIVLWISPDLTVEPLATYYLRRAESYAFVKRVLEENFGSGELRRLHRLTAPSGAPAKLSLAEELDQMRDLFAGAYLTAADQILLALSARQKLNGETIPRETTATFKYWLEHLDTDADVLADSRMMVPIGYDPEHHRTKVWAFLGWTHSSLSIDWEHEPKVLSITPVTDEAKRIDYVPEVRLEGETRSEPFPVVVELYVPKLLNRDEFRKVCDEGKNIGGVLQQLQQDQQ